MGQNFTKRIETFTCEACGISVAGNGYTNHCPRCLHSKHVDIVPGDRLAACRGLMRPTHIFQKHGDTIIEHHCQTCGVVKRNRSASDDSREAILSVIRGRLESVYER